MYSRTLAYTAGVLGVLVVSGSAEWNPCPSGRTLEQQIDSADVVALGKVIHDGDCRRPDPGTHVSRSEFEDCVGRRVNLTISRTWKGPAPAGDTLVITMPAPSDPGGLLMRNGETHVIFAKLATGATSPIWFGQTTACMLPEGQVSAARALIKQLDLWFKTQES